MSEKTTTHRQPPKEKPGFFKRIVTKMDDAMKAKADQKSQSNCCSGDDKGSGGKCC